jgi:hypothetical protein
MSSPAFTIDPSVKSNVVPLFAESGGPVNLVNDKLVGDQGLAADLSSEGITSNAARNLSVENAERAVQDFKEAHESGAPVDVQRQLANRMSNSFGRMNPNTDQSQNMAEEAFKAVKKMIESIAKMLRKLFGMGGNENTHDNAGPSSGYGADFDKIMKNMEGSEKRFEENAKKARHEEEMSMDADSSLTPQPPKP